MKMNAQTVMVSAAVVVAGLVVLNIGAGVGRLHQRGQNALAPVSNAIGRTWANVSMRLNGSHSVDYTQGGFYLNDKYIDDQYKLAPVFVESIKKTHPDNAVILGELLGADGRIKSHFRSLIDTIVTTEDVGL